METKEILSELNKEYKPVKISGNDETSLPKADKFNAVRTSFTSENIFYLDYEK